jgi:transposase
MLNFHFTLTNPRRQRLENKLRAARRNGDVSLVTRILAILSLSAGRTTEQVAEILHVSTRSINSWFTKYLLLGLAGLYRNRPKGRPAKLTKSQKRELSRIIEQGPTKSGYVGNCWRSPMIQELIHDHFGVFYSVKYIAQLLKNLGFSFQKARFESDHLDQDKRKEWLEKKFPEILAEAKRENAYLLFGDEASFPQWGTLGYTWARKGKQPTVKTGGKRKGYKVFGLVDYFTGEFLYKCQEERLNSETYAAFLEEVLSQSGRKIIVIQDGARYHTSAAMAEFFARHTDCLKVYQLPSYSPDYNPIEKLWKKVKEKGTHLHYFPTFESLKAKVHQSLMQFKNAPEEVLSLFVTYHELDNVA